MLWNCTDLFISWKRSNRWWQCNFAGTRWDPCYVINAQCPLFAKVALHSIVSNCTEILVNAIRATSKSIYPLEQWELGLIIWNTKVWGFSNVQKAVRSSTWIHPEVYTLVLVPLVFFVILYYSLWKIESKSSFFRISAFFIFSQQLLVRKGLDLCYF